MDRFQLNPQSLFEEAKKIRIICNEEGYAIPYIEAFQQIGSWDEFMRLLDSLRTNKSKFTFELLISAIIQFAVLCGG